MAPALATAATAEEEEQRQKYLKQQIPPPRPAYLPAPNQTVSPLKVDQAVYRAIAEAPRTLVESFVLPIRSGRAWKAPARSVVRISTPEGPQVGDLNIWSLHNPRERFWASRTRQLHQSHLSTYDRLWSCLPYMRPLCTIINDSLAWYQKDQYGGRCHDLLGTRCDPYINVLLSGAEASYDYHCHSNLARAVIPWGLNESDVHDVINIFQVTGLDEEGRYFMNPSPAQPTDYLEFFAEQDLLMALSTCPGGDLSKWGFGSDNEQEMIKCCRPLKVEVFKLDDEESVLGGGKWTPPERPQYKGVHGMAVPEGEKR